MDKRYLFPCVLVILGLVISFFGPFVIAQNQAIQTYFAIFCTHFSLINVLFILGYIFIILGVILFCFKNKKASFIFISSFLFLLAGFIFSFSESLMQFVLDEEVVFISATPILLAGFSFVSSVYLFLKYKPKNNFKIIDIVEIAMLISLAVVADLFLKIPMGATGGSINLAMLPLMIIALRHNFYKSFIGCGLVYGLTTCLTDGYGLMYLPFDYVLGFGSVAIISLFRHFIFKKDCDRLTVKGIILLFVSCVLVFVLRTLASTISSMVYYGYTFDAGILYNITYIGPSVGACFVVVLLLYKPLLMLNKRYSRD